MHAFTSVIVFCCSVFCGYNCFAQNLQADTLAESIYKKEVVKYFNTSIGSQSEIYNGAVYTLFPTATKGTFYFQDKNFVVPSQIIYSGTSYKNVPVLYDVYHDQMVSAVDNQLFVLIPENLSDVYLNGHHFISILSGLAPGYYDEIYGGKSQVLIKRTKGIEEHIVPPQTAQTWYVDKAQVYVKTAKRYLPISSRSALLKIFQDKRQELDRYLNDNKLNYTADPENTVARAAAYYDQLNH